jgi:CRISPR-associated Cas5-like protein
MAHESPLMVKVWCKDGALFTRPEFGAERVSYPVMTPSAARGVLEAIFWKPEFTWRVREIKVLNPIRHFSILRNEMNSWQSASSAKSPDFACGMWPTSSRQIFSVNPMPTRLTQSIERNSGDVSQKGNVIISPI